MRPASPFGCWACCLRPRLWHTAIRAVRQRVCAKPADPQRSRSSLSPHAAGGGLDCGAAVGEGRREHESKDICIQPSVRAGWSPTRGSPPRNNGSVIGLVSNSVLGDSLRAGGKWTYKDIEPVVFLIRTGSLDRFDQNSVLTSPLPTSSQAKASRKINIGSMAQTVYEFLAEQIETATGAQFARCRSRKRAGAGRIAGRPY